MVDYFIQPSTPLVVVRHVFPKFQNDTVWRATRSGFWPNMYSVLPDVVFHGNGHILPIAILPKTTSGSSSKCATDQIQSYHISKIFNTDNLLLNSSIKIGNLYIIINDFFPSNRSFIKENGDSFYFSPAMAHRNRCVNTNISPLALSGLGENA